MPASTPTSKSHLGRRSAYWVALGGAVGSSARILVDHLAGAGAGDIPASTLVVNLAGSFLLGVYLARQERAVTPPWVRPFWAVGVFGSFTTFSAFSLDVVQLAQAGRAPAAGAYVVVSVVGGLAAALTGHRLGAAVP